ncbi:hypothetical protein Psi02_63970 [Planotetraspora silvatica]|uniref:Uncharacterized protein n=1 Tax=Planotetraspora silvatica TaxID=234614 RepID=A0A8J3URF9_9ACTN|nr:hypothetical protein Psi02_63970 [Planotetraspora silvatica]
MTLQELATRYPDWVIWRGASETGPQGWYATRRAVSLSMEQLTSGMAQTVCGDDAPGLLVELERQTEIALRLAAAPTTGKDGLNDRGEHPGRRGEP